MRINELQVGDLIEDVHGNYAPGIVTDINEEGIWWLSGGEHYIFARCWENDPGFCRTLDSWWHVHKLNPNREGRNKKNV